MSRENGPQPCLVLPAELLKLHEPCQGPVEPVTNIRTGQANDVGVVDGGGGRRCIGSNVTIEVVFLLAHVDKRGGLPAEDDEDVPAHGDPPIASKSKSLSGAVSPSPMPSLSHEGTKPRAQTCSSAIKHFPVRVFFQLGRKACGCLPARCSI
eukprot:261004-Hanusia_phi.AAC.3